MGILNVNKDSGMTSHDVVAIVRRTVGERRVGHSGTLDPMACGVLPIFIGRATRLAEYQSEQAKEYLFTMAFGQLTDTLDVTGTVIRKGKDAVSESAFREALSSFLGTTMQRPPMYSAVKVNGKKLYEYARNGKEVERPSRPITITALDVVSFDGHTAQVRCRCSKGTYIRQLIADVAEKLDTVAVMTALVRSRVGFLSLDDALSMEAIKHAERSVIEAHLIPADRAVAHYPAMRFTKKEGLRLLQGQKLRKSEALKTTESLYRFYAEDVFLGMGREREEEWHLEKGIAEGKDVL